MRSILTLSEEPLDPEALAAAGLAGLHLPVRDFAAPTLEQLETGVSYIAAQAACGRALVSADASRALTKAHPRARGRRVASRGG